MKRTLSIILTFIFIFTFVSVPAFAEDSSDTDTEETKLTPLDEVVVDGVTLPDLCDFASRNCIFCVVRNTNDKILLYVARDVTSVYKHSSGHFFAHNDTSTIYWNCYMLNNSYPASFTTYSSTQYILNGSDFIYSSIDILDLDKSTVLFEKNLQSFELNICSDTDTDINSDNQTVNNISVETSPELIQRVSRIEFMLFIILLFGIFACIIYLFWRLIYMCV